MKSEIKRAVIFDSGALISLSMAGLLGLIAELKKNFDGKFLITSGVKHEIIDRPLKIKRFELEALRAKRLLESKSVELPEAAGVRESDVSRKTKEMMDFANSMFKGRGKNVKIMDEGEASCLALSAILRDKGVENLIVVDERTARMLVEKPEDLRKFLEKKMHRDLQANNKSMDAFQDFKMIRSTELAYVAYKKGLVRLKGAAVLDALLYALKFKGASISGDEIEEMKSLAKG